MNHKTKHRCFHRTLALAIRAQRFGYALFEGTDALLDWGVKSHSLDKPLSFESSVADLQKQFEPSVVLALGLENVSTTAIPIRVVDESTLRQFFRGIFRKNKHEISEAVATRYPDLAWQLPPKRKTWQSEPCQQLIFDAASLGVFYFSQCDTPMPHIPLVTD